MIWRNQRSPAPIPVKEATELLGVSKSGYYAWLKRKGYDNRAARDRPIVEEIMKIIHQFPGYGYRRVERQLRRLGYVVNHKRVLRLMRENGLTFKVKKFRPVTTDSEHDNPVYPNLVRGLRITGQNQVWASDFTYIQLRREFVYLAVVLDLHSRRCLGWSLSRDLSSNTALEALHMALYARKDDPISGLMKTALEFSPKMAFQNSPPFEAYTPGLRGNGLDGRGGMGNDTRPMGEWIDHIGDFEANGP
jgi:putative transposase